MFSVARVATKTTPAVRSSAVRSFSLAMGDGPKGEALPEGDVKDMSIHGMCIASIKKAFGNFFTEGPATKGHAADGPLGRWKGSKTGVDKHTKGYSYDHSA
jgi:hypothetical protein